MNPQLRLAIMFRGRKGGATTLTDLVRYYREPSLCMLPTKWVAVRTIVEGNLWLAEGYGHGNRARRRVLQLRQARRTRRC